MAWLALETGDSLLNMSVVILSHQAGGRVLPGVVTTQMSWEHPAPVVTTALPPADTGHD